MRSLLFLLLICLGVTTGCRPAAADPHTFRLDDEELARLLLDVQLAEITLPGLPAAQQDSLRRSFREALSKRYGLTDDELREEIRQLEMIPERHKAVVDRMKMLNDSLR